MKAVVAMLALFAGLAWAEDSAGPPAQAQEAEAAPEADAADAQQADVPDLSSRGRYNQGLALLEAGDLEAAADAFLAARDGAGPDPTLRYRAAFNLALALAAGVAADAPPEEAIETLRLAAAWFGDAVRLAPPDDDDARVNLELVSRRILALADQLNDGNRLEARLDRLIDDQRGIRDDIRALLAAVAAEGAGTEPLGFKGQFDRLASRERTLMAEAGESVDLAAQERLFIEQTPEEERTPEQRSRAYQLRGVTDYLERGRQSLGDSRRRLRRLKGERAHRRADAALAELKRAREQLHDPVTVLRAVLRDELSLIDHTRAFAVLEGGAIRLDQPAPPWLTAKHLAERQQNAAARTGGVLAQFDAIAAAGSPGENPQGQRTQEAVLAATPVLDQGLAAMRAAKADLDRADASAAIPEQQRAAESLRRAIEEFADAKGLIELAYASQQGIVGLLDPAEESAVAELATAERIDTAGGLVADNDRRLTRLQTLLEEDAAAADQVPATPDEAGAEQAQAAREASKQRFELAEMLRARAADGLAALDGELERLAGGGSDPLPARQATRDSLEALEELRRLFFSIVEHLRELHAEQTDTHDRTATAQFEGSADADEPLAADLGLAAARQNGHAQIADALANALAEQADAAASADGTEAGAVEQAAKIADAAREVREAGNRMHGAGTALTDAAERSEDLAPELEPALADQVAAIEHLENALAALSPPQQQQEQNQGQDQGQEQQQAAPQPSEDEEMSQRQARKRLQAIRDREAERQRRRQAQAGQMEPVEKDW